MAFPQKRWLSFTKTLTKLTKIYFQNILNKFLKNDIIIYGAKSTYIMGVEFIMDTIIVIMLKNKETGFLEKELSSITLEKNDEFILNVFAVEEQSGTYLHIRLTTDRDVADWEYNAILDFYDIECFKDKVTDIFEIEESYNPSWEVVVKYTEDDEKLRSITEDILEIHRKELYDVYETIIDKESEYSE